MKNRPRLHKFMNSLLKPFIKIYAYHAFGYRSKEQLKSDGPLLILSNHTTNMDFMFVTLSLADDVYFVASEHTSRSGFFSKFLSFFFEPIYHDKANVGVSTVLKIIRHLKAGHHVCIFAEGIRSFNGQSLRGIANTAAVAQKLKVKVATMRIHGGYFTNPLWGKSLRKGKMHSEWVNIYSPEQLKSMTPEEFSSAINRDIYVDAYADIAENPVPYKGKNLAENIQFVLVACPKCHQLNQIKSKDNQFFCKCGLHGTIDEYGQIEGEDFPYKTITEWDHWQRKFISGLDFQDKDQVFAFDDEQILKEVSTEKGSAMIDRGRLSITPEKIIIGRHEFYFDHIRRFNMILQGYMIFSTRDDKFYEIINPANKYAGYLYILLIEHFSGRKAELTDRLY